MADLEGAELDAAVARALGWQRMVSMPGWCMPSHVVGLDGDHIDTSTYHAKPHPWSTDWAHGGPIIERERITIVCHVMDRSDPAYSWDAMFWPVTADADGDPSGIHQASGPTPLIAAMRAFVASMP